MSTKSLIARRIGVGFDCICCNWDGYPEHQAPILTKHYTTENAVNTLLDLGDLSFLGPEIGEAHEFLLHEENPAAQNWCLFYARDRGDVDRTKQIFTTEAALLNEAKACYANYIYLFQNNKWYVVYVEERVWVELS